MNDLERSGEVVLDFAFTAGELCQDKLHGTLRKVVIGTGADGFQYP
jgi:hypothetical protein